MNISASEKNNNIGSAILAYIGQAFPIDSDLATLALKFLNAPVTLIVEPKDDQKISGVMDATLSS